MKTESRRGKLHNNFKAELKEIALELFAKRGYEQVSYGDIAFAAGISQRVMPRYFSEKENILVDDLDEGASAFCVALKAQPGSVPPIEAFEQAMINAEYPAYYFEHLLAADIYRDRSLKLSAAFNEFGLRWQTEVATAIAEWLGISNRTEFPPIFWASAIFTALRHTLRSQAGEAGLRAEFTNPPQLLAMVFGNLRMMASSAGPGISASHGMQPAALQLVN